jgi:hypothetical protein
MDRIGRSAEIYRNEGIRTLIYKSIRHIYNKTFPAPTVKDPNAPKPVFILKYVFDWWFNIQYGTGTDVMTEDWDTLILLDACRFDDFKKINELTGELDSRISRGVDSNEFIRENFLDKEFHDTVYVTANPHVDLLNGDEFYDTVTEPIEQWDADLGCVRPKVVTNAAKRAHRKYPNKKMIVHYMQPHDPPLGTTADRLRDKYNIGGPISEDTAPNRDRIMELVADGTISIDNAHTAYRETLEIVLTEVESLLDTISGKVVVSADHGEHFGEQPYPLLGQLYEHYQNPRTIELCKVPWFVAETDMGRREIKGEKSTEAVTPVSEEAVEEQLQALGYR